MNTPIFLWAAVALAVLVAELLSGTIYLLALAAGLTMGAVLQWLTGSWSVAAGGAALVTAAGSALAHRLRRSRQTSRMIDVDFGGEARLLRPLGDERWRVAFRGAEWDARIASGAENAHPEKIGKVCGREGNLLVLTLH